MQITLRKLNSRLTCDYTTTITWASLIPEPWITTWASSLLAWVWQVSPSSTINSYRRAPISRATTLGEIRQTSRPSSKFLSRVQLIQFNWQPRPSTLAANTRRLQGRALVVIQITRPLVQIKPINEWWTQVTYLDHTMHPSQRWCKCQLAFLLRFRLKMWHSLWSIASQAQPRTHRLNRMWRWQVVHSSLANIIKTACDSESKEWL